MIKALTEGAMAGVASSLSGQGEGALMHMESTREEVEAEEPPDAVASLWCAGIVGSWATLRHGATLHGERAQDTWVVARMTGRERGVSMMGGCKRRLLLTL